MKNAVQRCVACWCVASAIAVFPLFADTASSSAALDAAYASSFYPGVVRYADELLRTSPNSPVSMRAAVYKGEALYRMGRAGEAFDVLSPLAPDSAELRAAQNYWLGRILSDRKDYARALDCFFKSAKDAKDKSELSSYYAYSLLYAADLYRALSDDERALPLYVYVSEHGSQYALNDYERAIIALLSCYNAVKDYKRALALSNAVDNAPFTSEGLARIRLLQADALQESGDYKTAYTLYCRVLSESDSAPLAAEAMQKAYSVSSSHKREVGAEPGAVLKEAQKQLSDYPSLLAEFWLRLALDAYNAGERDKALSYFDEAENASDAAKASAKEESERIMVTVALYRAELALSEDSGDIAARAKNALSVLESKTGAKSADIPQSLSGAVSSTRARLYGLCADWKNCALQADSALSSGDSSVLLTAVYWKAVALYQTGRFSEACALIEEKQASFAPIANDIAIQTLYARALAQDGKTHDADVLFYALGEKGALDNDGTLDYAKSLLNGGYMISASTQAGKATGAEADYLSGLAAFNRKQWKLSAECFTKSLNAKNSAGSGSTGAGNGTAGSGIANTGALSSQYVPYARFYCGYAQYRAGLYEKAYSSLTAFLADSSSQTHSLRFLALTTAVRASVQSGSYSRAFPLAEEAVRASQNDTQKQEAVFLCAGVYSDAQNYDKALSTLAPYAAGRSQFAFQCRYQTAQIQTLKKDYAGADKTYAALSREKTAGALAEEAGYRRGELCYSTERYADSIPLFDEYCKKWGEQGQFYDAARFFAANALVKTGDTDRAILYYKQVDTLRAQSPYKYSAEKALMELYKNQRDYSAAIGYAQKLLDGYGEQARDDGIASAIDELKKLELGYDEPTAAKEQEYERLGKTRTTEGRNAGTELASLWVTSAIYRQRAVTLAENLLAVQKQHLPQEAGGAAKNALLIARAYREQTENARAADLYLQAAGFARQAGDDASASQALYGAVEAFDACGRYGDARATAQELEKLYPKSRFVEAANKIVNPGE